VSTGTRVDFYILANDAPQGRLQFACRLTEKAYALDHRVYAHTTSPEEAATLDELLWTFRQGSFIPHSRLENDTESRAPVTIGMPERCLQEGDLLINLSAAAPDFATNFSRVAEIVAGNEKARQAGRDRYKQYRAMGLEPETHKID